MCKPWAEEGRSLPLSSSSAGEPYCYWSCLDGRHRGDSCPQSRRCDQFLQHSRTARYRSDPALTLAEVAGGVTSALPLGANAEEREREGEEGAPSWGHGAL